MQIKPDMGPLVFREAQDTGELEQLFRVRYKAYSTSAIGCVEPRNQVGLNIDSYDLHARHFGVFQLRGRREIAVGTLRCIQDVDSPPNRMVEEIAHEYPSVSNLVSREGPFEVMLKYADRAAIRNQYLRMRQDNHRIIEVGRLSLAKEAQSLGLAMQIQLAVRGAIWDTVDWAFVHCVARHEPFYRRTGFQRVPGTSVRSSVESALVPCVVLIGSPKSVPAQLRPLIRAMASEYQTTGRIGFQKDRIAA